MPLATKNGSLIVKNGSMAENCNCCVTVTTLCQLGSIAVSTSGTAFGLEAITFPAYPCRLQSYSLGVSGSGTVYFYLGNGPFRPSNVCNIPGMVPRCGFDGAYSLGANRYVNVLLRFFSVGSNVRYAVIAQVSDNTEEAKLACRIANPSLSMPLGGTRTYQGCSDTVGTMSSSGALLVDLSSVPPLTIMREPGYTDDGGSITFSFNPLP